MTRWLRTRWRGGLDIALGLGFVCCLVLLMMRPSVSALGGGGVALELSPSAQRRGLYRGDARIGSITERVARAGDGWRVTQRYRVAGTTLGTVALRLYRDLSLARVEIDADLLRLPLFGGAGKLGQLGAGLSGTLRRLLARFGRIKLRGSCEAHRGRCWLRGRIGKQPVARDVSVGRGPVLTSAIFPLLARGSLGRKAELSIFNPLALTTRVVTLSVGKREKLTLRSGETVRALRVEQQSGLLRGTVWIDSRGRVMRESLAGGLSTEHEAWLQ